MELDTNRASFVTDHSLTYLFISGGKRVLGVVNDRQDIKKPVIKTSQIVEYYER